MKKMTVNKFKRKSVSLDDASVDRAKRLAADRSTTVSGILRLLIKDAFDALQQKKELTI
jgi:hypothetical protein